ncbi:MAG: hypothetical protein AAF598_19045, partial [Bacteroidota bacterium]
MMLRSTIFICLFLLSGYSMLAQDVIYEPVFISQCTGEHVDIAWSISDSIVVQEISLIQGTDTSLRPALLSEPYFNYQKRRRDTLRNLGEFKLSLDTPIIFTLWWENPVYKVNIEEKGLIKDTFYLPRLQKNHQPPLYVFKDCGVPAEGEIVDFYQPGKKRIEGIFENGVPTDSATLYYFNGNLEQIYINRKPFMDELLFYENGNPLALENANEGYQKQFDESGRISREKTWSWDPENGMINKVVKEFYPSGNLKFYRSDSLMAEYDTSGVLIEEIVVKPEEPQKGWLQWSSYNESGELNRMIILCGVSWGSTLPNDFSKKSFSSYTFI